MEFYEELEIQIIEFDSESVDIITDSLTVGEDSITDPFDVE